MTRATIDVESRELGEHYRAVGDLREAFERVESFPATKIYALLDDPHAEVAPDAAREWLRELEQAYLGLNGATDAISDLLDRLAKRLRGAAPGAEAKLEREEPRSGPDVFVLPTREEYDRVSRMFGDAFNELEHLIVRLRPLSEPDNTTVVPTIEDIGRLCSLRIGIDYELDQSKEEWRELGRILRALDARRLDAEAKGRR